ncbi:MAG: PilN domain-containing protein [Planctomycetota bacterium]
MNFLPKSYRQARSRRGRVMRRVALVAAAAGCVGAATVGMKAHSRSLRLTAERLEDTVQTERTTMGVITGLDKRRSELLAQFDLKRELVPALTYSQVLSALSATLPEGVAVSELAMRSVRPKPEPRVVPEATGRRGGGAVSEEPAYEPDVVGVELIGLAPDDLSVASWVAALDGHPFFSKVSLRSTRPVETRGLIARRFSLSAVVDLDREFRWNDGGAERVADAGSAEGEVDRAER